LFPWDADLHGELNSEKLLKAGRHRAVARHGHQVDTVEGAGLADAQNLIAGRGDAGVGAEVSRSTRASGMSMSGMLAARLRAMAGLASAITPA